MINWGTSYAREFMMNSGALLTLAGSQSISSDEILDFHQNYLQGGLEATLGIEGSAPETPAAYHGRQFGRNSIKAVGIVQTGVGFFEIGSGITGLGASALAEMASGGAATPLAIPAATASIALIADGAAKIVLGSVLLRNSSGKGRTQVGNDNFRELASKLKFTKKTAGHMSRKARYVPRQTLAEAIKAGKRMKDPQGAQGAIKIVQDIEVNGKQRMLEIIYRESDHTILHFLYK